MAKQNSVEVVIMVNEPGRAFYTRLNKDWNAGNIPATYMFIDINHKSSFNLHGLDDIAMVVVSINWFDEFCTWIEKVYNIETYCEIILDTVIDEQDPESINYVNAYMHFNQIQMTVVDEQGPGGGNPQVLYRGARADLERMIHDLFEDDDLASMITQS